jgi:N-acylneuraminate cytidylyltransferase
MIGGHQVTALIPARGGSTTVERKNLRRLGEKPLLAWPIDTATKVSAIDRVVVSTDDEDIAACATEYGAGVDRRPKELATDGALVIDAIRYHLNQWKSNGKEASILVLLEPTCPFRAVEDVEKAIGRLVQTGCDSVATFCRAEVNPWRTWRVKEGEAPVPFIDGADPWRPRQKLPDAHQLNGGVYAFFADRLPEDGKTLLFGNARAVIMPEERSVDIDTELDFLMAQQMLQKRRAST